MSRRTAWGAGHPGRGAIVPAGFGPVQFARGTSGVSRWYRRVAGPRPVVGVLRRRAAMMAARATHESPGYDRAMELPATFDGRPGLADTMGRAMRDLRISVTDRCNFRCTYCMPKELFGRDYEFMPRDQVLSFEEIERVAGTFVGLGVEKLRVTGGEPLVRRDLPDLIAMLAALRRPDGGEIDLTLTTNGSALRALAGPLAAAGLRRVTVSLDSLDDAVFGAMNGIDFPVERVLDGIDAAIEAGLAPVKVNMVVRRGINESSIVPMAAWARETGVILRFIEYMDVGHSNGWRLDEVVPASDIVAMLRARWAVEPADPSYRGEVAERWRYVDGAGEFGVISSVTTPFCSDCTRARLSA
ncbi:MAG TPA: GTP 3',8-cyclase MoaA, partial [Candidatus Limnocylindrales bacterium]|nr:GTP 3',8-cyclase MoaA [Candidatus Limnocylindrales bacterium]